MELLRTRRLVLRTWRDDDLPAFFDLYSRWEVMRWLGPPPRRSLRDVQEAGERLARWHRRAAGLPAPYGLWALVPDLPGAPATGPRGTLLLLPLHDAEGLTREVEIGWHLHPDYQGRGLITEGAQALLGAAAAAGLARILALTDPDNAASQAVARRLAMVDVGLTSRWFGFLTRQFEWTPEPNRTGTEITSAADGPVGPPR